MEPLPRAIHGINLALDGNEVCVGSPAARLVEIESAKPRFFQSSDICSIDVPGLMLKVQLENCIIMD